MKLEAVKRRGKFEGYAWACPACGCGYKEKKKVSKATCPCCDFQVEFEGITHIGEGLPALDLSDAEDGSN